MTEPQEPNTRNGTTESPPGVPLWVKISGLVVLIVVAILVVAMLLVGGEHGPGLHTGALVTSSAMGDLGAA